jgi:hypothetical protein
MKELWAWLALAGLGAFHGLNPAMGWLFAVALGLHRHSRSAVFRALPPIALGHALSIAVVAGTVIMTGVLISGRSVLGGTGLLLIGWAIYHQLYGHRHRVRVGMQAGLAGLTLWSFLMATAHGAGLMLVPALIPLCLTASPAGDIAVGGSPGITSLEITSLGITLAAVGIHTGAMLAVTGLVAVVVYEWIGIGILRSAWVNVDAIWTGALAVTGGVLLASL